MQVSPMVSLLVIHAVQSLIAKSDLRQHKIVFVLCTAITGSNAVSMDVQR
jgi:hypothetical protein